MNSLQCEFFYAFEDGCELYQLSAIQRVSSQYVLFYAFRDYGAAKGYLKLITFEGFLFNMGSIVILENIVLGICFITLITFEGLTNLQQHRLTTTKF